MTTTARHLDLDGLRLERGGHNPDGKFCVMEAVAYVAGERWSDSPSCTSRVIGNFLRSWNDALNGDDRQLLKPLIPRLVGTAGSDEIEDTRSWMALDWYCRVSAPRWLRAAGLEAAAATVESTRPITGPVNAAAAQGTLDEARRQAYAARDAARNAAWDALRPVVVELQRSALELLEHMIALTAVAA
jgi:hypothetical protein